ncbi:MAG: hypothetical protein H0W31_07120 [Actinobacteria bacterium]|nr:hypothetical protein [Actinomycetota bacterium]
MTSDVINDALERLAPAQTFVPDWLDVVQRAGEAPRPAPSRIARARPGKRWLLGVALAVAVLSPFAILAAATDDWWLLKSHGPAPSIPPPLVVKTGSWDGYGWALVAYRNEEGDLCFSMNPTSSGFGAAPNCGGFVNEPGGDDDTQRRIMYLSGVSAELPAYVVGPVVEAADEVVIYFAGGELRTPTFEVPASLGAIKFFAARVPETLDPTGSVVDKLIALDSAGRTVACLAVRSEGSCG